MFPSSNGGFVAFQTFSRVRAGSHFVGYIKKAPDPPIDLVPDVGLTRSKAHVRQTSDQGKFAGRTLLLQAPPKCSGLGVWRLRALLRATKPASIIQILFLPRRDVEAHFVASADILKVFPVIGDDVGIQCFGSFLVPTRRKVDVQ